MGDIRNKIAKIEGKIADKRTLLAFVEAGRPKRAKTMCQRCRWNGHGQARPDGRFVRIVAMDDGEILCESCYEGLTGQKPP